MKILGIADLRRAFELGGRDRMLPMEGLRGVAVGLVFLQHYCMQFTTNTNLTGVTQKIALFFRDVGNFGVDLFFVLSGYLIYGILIRKRQAFFDFMARRAQRLYPAFLVALAIGTAADLARPEAKIPSGLIDGGAYWLANFFFLPGLLPIEPLFVVNWSLSYEWWFYATATLLFAVLRLAALPAGARASLIGLFGAVLLGLSASGVPNVPVRGLCLLGGMLLVEARAAGLPPLSGLASIILVAAGITLRVTVAAPPWLGELVLACSLWTLCYAAFGGGDLVARPLSWTPLRWFGNISYSYYLVHGFAAVVALRLMFYATKSIDPHVVFWAAFIPVYAATFCAGAALFLWVEKPWSLQRARAPAKVSAETRGLPAEHR